jgi:hypothetical protein
MPSQWAVNAVNTMLSPQLKGQFRGSHWIGVEDMFMAHEWNMDYS